MLVQQRANDIVYELVFAVSHIERKGAYECKNGCEADLAADFKNGFHLA